MIFCLNYFEKKLKTSLIWNPIFFSLSIRFELFKKQWVHQVMIYNTFLNSKCSKAMRKQFNLKIQNCDILFEMFWKKTLNISSLKPHIFFIVSTFWVI
jgi:hypothetical protein